MTALNWKEKQESFDERRDIVMAGNAEQTIQFCAQQFLQIGQEAIQEKGQFTVALSGGQTPHAIFKRLSQSPFKHALDWSKVLCFWSDERSVPPTDPENNYFSAWQAGLKDLPLKPENIFRMHAEEEIEENAKNYEALIRQKVPSLAFDLVMLGMGEDGHTASLFPQTHGLHATDRLVIANFVPQKHTWRMSLTYDCIHNAKTIVIYVIGPKKAPVVARVLTGPYQPDLFPIQRIGTPTHKATWILDQEASQDIAPSTGI